MDLREAFDDLAARVARLEAAQRTLGPGPAIRQDPGETRRQRAVELVAVETRLGSYWAARLGIVSLVTGVAFAVANGFAHFGPLLRALCGYVAAGALAAFGYRVARQHRRLGQILIAGGLGVGYYTTYALHHVPSVQLIHSPEVGFALLALSVIGIVCVAQRMRSETVAGLALFLGLHTGMVSEVGVFTLASGCLLAGGAAFFMVRNRWVIVPLSTLVAVYSTLVTWMLGNPLTAGAVSHPADHLPTALGFVALYYLTFAIAVARAPAQLHRLAASTFALLNWFGAAAIAAFELDHHGAGGAELLFGALAIASLGLAAISARRIGRRDGFHLHLALAAISLALASWAAFDGAPLVGCLAAVAAISAAAARSLDSRALRCAAAAIAGVAVLAYVGGGADDAVLALVVIASLVAYERLDPAAAGAVRLVPVSGVGLVGLATAAALAPVALVTAAWVAIGAAVFAAGLALRAQPYRLVALVIFAVGFLRLFFHDLAAYAAIYRIVSFLLAGAILLAVSYAYTRRSGAVR